MKILIIICLISVALSTRLETYNFGFSTDICLDTLVLNMPPSCYTYELDCQDCYDQSYLDTCVFLCKNENSQNQQCSSKCTKIYEKCEKCFYLWSKCTCPLGTNSIKYDNGTSACQLLPCKKGYYRTPTSKCVTCNSCDEKCAECQASPTNCQSCTDGYCLVETNKCVNPKTYKCPGGLYKHYSDLGCPICEAQCPTGSYPNSDNECVKCPEGCTSCKSATNCDTCDEFHCLYLNQCVAPDFKCPSKLYKKKNTFNQCFACVECQECTANTFCDDSINECNPNCNYPPTFIFETKCIDQCPQNSPIYTIEDFKVNPADVGKVNSNSWNSWTSNTNIQITNCGGATLLGGYGVFGNIGVYVEKVYNNLPQHSIINVAVTVYFVDSWDNERFVILADGGEVYYTTSNYPNHAQGQICGSNSWNDEYRTITFQFSHTMPSLKLRFVSELQQGPLDESWGIKDLKMTTTQPLQDRFLIYNAPNEKNECVYCDSCPVDRFCDKVQKKCEICPSPNFIWNRDCILECPQGRYRKGNDCVEKCPDRQYGNDATKLCEPCDKNCLNCVGSATTCQFPCPKGLIFSNNKCIIQCLAGQYVSKDTTSLIGYLCYPSENDDCKCLPCNSKCATCIGPNSNDCITCPSPLYLKNGQCLEICPVGDYLDKNENTCNCCHVGCSSCYGPRIDECNSCDANHFKIGSTCYPNANNIPGSSVQLILAKQKNANI